MTIEFERQELQALSLQPIKHLPDYSADYTAACRAGSVIAAQNFGITPGTYGWALEKILSTTVMRAKFPTPSIEAASVGCLFHFNQVGDVGCWHILLQKLKVAVRRVLRENMNREHVPQLLLPTGGPNLCGGWCNC